MITLPKLCHVLGALIVLSGLSTARVNADTATTYELIQSGQATRSGFYGLAGELHSPLPAESYQLKAIGSMQTGAVVSIIGKIPASGLYIIELPVLPLPHWEVCLIHDDKIVAGPVKIDVARPGMGIDWTLSADATAAATALPTSTALEIHPNGPWNRNVTRAIVAMNETATGRKWPESVHRVPYPKQPPAKVLDEDSSDKDPLKRTAQNVDSLEDATLIRLADILSTPEAAARLVSLTGGKPTDYQLRANNVETESVELRITEKYHAQGSVFIRVSRFEGEELTTTNKSYHGLSRFSPYPRSIGPELTEPVPEYKGVYSNWKINADIIATDSPYLVYISITSPNSALLSQKGMTGVLKEVMSVLKAAQSQPTALAFSAPTAAASAP